MTTAVPVEESSGFCYIDPGVAPVFGRMATQKNGLLTDRELEALIYTALGFTDAAIAERLFITQAALRSRLTQVYSKLDVADKTGLNPRTYAIAKAIRRGLITGDEITRWQDKMKI